jgi:hypothetical protein
MTMYLNEDTRSLREQDGVGHSRPGSQMIERLKSDVRKAAGMS